MILREAKDYMNKAYSKMVETSDTKELGKMLAIPSEYWPEDSM